MARRNAAPAAALPVEPFANAAVNERRDYLPADSGIAWIDKLREQHLAAVAAAERCVRIAAEVEDSLVEKQRQHRQATYEARAADPDAPAPPRDFDPDLLAADKRLAQEDVAEARLVLARVAADALTELRDRSDELPDDLALPGRLIEEIFAGPFGARKRHERQLREQLARSQAGGIVNIQDPANAALTQSEADETKELASA
jgi:hypothetical protein